MGKSDFNSLNQDFDNTALDSVKLKGFCRYEYMSGFVKFEEELCSKETFYSLLTSDEDYEHVLKVWHTF